MKEKLYIDDNLSLRRIRSDDVDVLFELVDTNRSHLGPHLPWVEGMTKKDSQVFVDKELERWGQGKGYCYLPEYQGNVAGVVATHDLNMSHKSVFLGYWLAQEFEGKGIIVRGVQALIDELFASTELHTIRIECMNKKSSMIPNKLGFHFEGVRRAAQLIEGKYVDADMWSLLRNEWSNNS